MTRPKRFDRPRRHVSDAGCFASDAELDCIARIEIGGDRGSDGTDGISYRNPPRGDGRHGQRGGDAGPARNGIDAGNVNLQLSYENNVRGTGRLHSIAIAQQPARSELRSEDSIEIGDSGYVFIGAAGGSGGNGGRGGDGQPGSEGRRGQDATRYSSGSNGGPGGNGGNAGNPSDGADGGEGGLVTVKVDHRDQGLLMLMKGNLDGGDIGFAGEPGLGGIGGKGGAGGSSYHWTETQSYRDAQGNTQTRTIFRSNPGGFSGSNGRNGAPSAYRAKDGRPGEPGQLRIIVNGPGDRQAEYQAPYDLELVTFDIASEYSILEPDSLVSIDRLMIRNCGGMPTPENYTIRIFLAADEWVHSDGVDLVMHRSLEPGETMTFLDHGLRFRLGDHVVDQPRRRPFRLTHVVNPEARMESGIHRPFRQFENGEEIEVRFPVELTTITSLRSIAPGESTRVLWAVTNIGDETFDHAYLRRAVKTSLRLLGGDLDTDQIVFFDDTDARFDLTQSRFSKPIADLKPGETRVFETRIGIKNDADVVPYQGFDFAIDLDAQRPGTSRRHSEFRCVDDRKSFVRVAERYRRDAGSRFLLIANHKTTVSDIEQWTRLADYFGSGLDVWDVSYYGFFDLVRAVERDASLLEQWRGMTMIVPNNYYQTPVGKTVAFDELGKSQFLRAAADHDINFYIVGDSRTGGASMLSTAMIPVDGNEAASSLTTRKDFLREVKRWTKYIERSRDVLGGATHDAHDFADESLGAVHELKIDKRTFLFQPKKTWLTKQASELQATLSKLDPLHRWVIVHRYDTGDTDTSWGFFRKRKIGKLELRRTLDATKGSVVLYEVDAIDMVGDEFINSRENKHGIFLALKFEDKVDRFIRLVSERKFPRYSEDFIDRPLTDDEISEIGQELVDSILVDIANEQRVVRNSRTWGRRGVASLMPKLNYLAERALNYGLTYRQMHENQSTLALLYDLIANIRFMAKGSKSVWDSAFIPTSFFKRSRAVSSHMLERVDRIVTSIFGAHRSWFDRMTGGDENPFGTTGKNEPFDIARTTADTELANRERELRAQHTSMAKYTTAQDHPGLVYDPELLPAATRVLSGETYDRLVASEELASRRRAATEVAIASERSDLLVPLSRPTPKPTTQPTALPTQM